MTVYQNTLNFKLIFGTGYDTPMIRSSIGDRRTGLCLFPFSVDNGWLFFLQRLSHRHSLCHILKVNYTSKTASTILFSNFLRILGVNGQIKANIFNLSTV